MNCMDLSLLLCCLVSILFGLTEGNCEKNEKAERFQFGPGCGYLCHCRDNNTQCHQQTGECRLGKCQPGWMGPACQYVNIAYGTTKNKAYDGEDSTCSEQSSMTIDLGKVYPIKEVTVVFDQEGASSKLRIKHESAGNWKPCFTSSWAVNKSVHSVCRNIIKAQHVEVTTKTHHTKICEIKINGGRNLAYGQKASQNGSHDGAVPMNAVDGTSGNGKWTFQEQPGSTCTQTARVDNPTWRLNLGSFYKVLWFRIYNRLHEEKICEEDQIDCENRLLHFILSVSNSSGMNPEVKLYEDERETLKGVDNPIEVTNISLCRGQYVQVTRAKSNAFLTLCEIEVLGDCPENTCGFTCNETCYCKDGSYVDKLQGKCFDGCQPGWTGNGKRCNNKCTKGMYGHDCSMKCGNCTKGAYCHHITGSCPGGECEPGWMGLKCDRECINRTYGHDCSTKCANCKNGAYCDHITGSCPRGECEPGWMGLKCDRECSPGTYGVNCTSKCGHCKSNSSCDPRTGVCSKGCEEGWDGSDKCDVKPECINRTYGHDCSTKCANCKNGAYCDHITGSCPRGECEPGWMGLKCDRECSPGTYGVNCTSKCGHCKSNSSCDPRAGVCSKGCEEGWDGSDKCDVKPDSKGDGKEEPGSSLPAIAGGISAVVFLAIIIILIICRRRRRRKPEGEEQSHTQRSSNRANAAVYSNAEIQDDGDENRPCTIIETPRSRPKDETYYNVCSQKERLPKGAVILSDLWDYVQNKISSLSSIEKEFKTLPPGLQHQCTAAMTSENIQKNRYKNLYAYDHSRVHLNPDTEDDGDYVNACFIDGFSEPKAFIASQGATQKNINDIWRMIWQQNCGKIVMLTNLIEHCVTKCEQYWPDEGEKQQYGSVTVANQECENFADYVIRTFRLSHTCGDRSKIVKHFHYTAWPDKDVPGVASSLVQFWNKVINATSPVKGPVLVHCSAGIGRTGTYIALDYLVEQGRKEGYVNFLDCIKKMREQRVNLVQTKEQYLFVHEAVVEALMLSGTGIASDQFRRAYMDLQQIDVTKKKTKLFLEFEKLQQGNPFDRERIDLADDEDVHATHVVDEYATAKLAENSHKNRYSNILAADKYRPRLSNASAGSTDYINAVYMPSHRSRSAFIITQMPLPTTVEDFWTLIHETEIKTIVMMNVHDQRRSQSKSAAYWPEQNEVTYGDYTIKILDNKSVTGFRTRDIRWTRNSTGDTSILRQFQFLAWPEDAKVPTDNTSLLHLFESILQWQRKSQSCQILVHCMDGAERSGLFCVLSTIIERLNIEQDVAVAQTIKKMRIIRHQIIPNYEQFQFCHDGVLEYLQTFDTYSNFAQK